MNKQTEALKLAIGAMRGLYGGWRCESAIKACEEALAQPEQKPVSWKLVPVQPTEEMLKAMDECSTEGYDERLYAGHAASVYMAAVDAAPASPQQCYCGDITRLGVVHRADSFCDEKPEQEPVVFLSEWSDWRNMVVQNLMRHGNVDKDFARRLAHYYQDMTPQRKPLNNQNPLLVFAKECVLGAYSETELADAAFRAIEAAHGIKE